MKGIIHSAVRGFALAFLIGISASAFGEVLTVTLQSGEWEWAEEGQGSGGQKILAREFGAMQVPGKPIMPGRIFYIAVPPDAMVADVTFEGKQQWVDGEFYIEPGGISLPARDFSDDELESARQQYRTNFENTYFSDSPFPSRACRYVGIGGFRKYQLVRVEYSPWQYFPASGRVLYTSEVSVRIEYEQIGLLEKHINLSDTAMDDVAQELIVNYKDAREWYAVGPQPLGTDDYQYIIMCTDATRDAVEPLADWKRSTARRVKIFTKEWLEANTDYPTYELERQIRYYLRDNYQTWNSVYFIIVGDTDVIPMRECTAGNGGTWPAATDTYYGELSLYDSESWDYDWDGNYAERTEDNIDWAMELIVGRIPDNDATTVQAICERMRDFEMDTGIWKDHALLLGAIWNYEDQDRSGDDKTDHAYTCAEMLGDWSWSGWITHTLYETAGLDPSPYTPVWSLTDTNVLSAWNTGHYSIVNMGGHGNSYGIYRRIWQSDDGDGNPRDDQRRGRRYAVLRP